MKPNLRTTLLAISFGLLALCACSKELPSSPGGSGGTPVIVRGQPDVGISRNIVFKNGEVENKSGFTIYNFRVAMTVWRDAPFFAAVTDTSELLLDSVWNNTTVPFKAFEVFGDSYIGHSPVYTIIPPTP